MSSILLYMCPGNIFKCLASIIKSNIYVWIRSLGYFNKTCDIIQQLTKLQLFSVERYNKKVEVQIYYENQEQIKKLREDDMTSTLFTHNVNGNFVFNVDLKKI